MGISFGPLPSYHVDAQVRGSFSLRGLALGFAVTNESALLLGGFGLAGFAEGEVYDDYVVPPSPVRMDGGFALGGHMEAYAHVSGEMSTGPFALRGGMFGAGLGVTSGGFRLGGGMAYVAPVEQYGFVVEQNAVVSSIAGTDYAFVKATAAMRVEHDPILTLLLRELAAFSELRRGSYSGTASVEDGVILGERAAWVAFGIVNDLLLVDVEATGAHTAVGRALERMLLSGSVRNIAEAEIVLLDALVLRALADAYHHGVAADTLLTAVFIDSLYAAFAQVLDRALLASAVGPTYSFTALVDDHVAFGDALTHEADIAAVIRDAVGFAMSLSIDGGEYIAWVMNTQSKGMTRYTQYPFNSFGKLGRYVGCAADGLHWLDADDDNGEDIHSVIRTSMDALGVRREKRLPEAFVGYTSTGTLLLKVVLTGEQSGQLEAAYYRLPLRPAESKRENRFKVGKGLKAVDFAFVIENVDGADFELDSIEFRPINLDRRTRG